MAQHKAFRLAEFKAAADGEVAGTFEAVVSVFGNTDLGGDRVMPGAFEKSIASWRDSGDPIPVIWSHNWENPDAHIGFVDPADAMETPDGLLVSGQLDVDKPFAKQVYDLLKSRRVKEMSFAYDIGDQAKGDDGANELTELDLIELGPTLKGMNPATELVSVKAAGGRATKAMVQLDGSAEQLRDRLGAAVVDWALTYRHDDVYLAAVEATFDDHVIAYVEAWDEPMGGGTYYQLPYTVEGDAVVLGEPTPVAITGAVTPKAHLAGGIKRAAKSGARNSAADTATLQQVHDLVAGLGVACVAAESGEASADESKSRSHRALVDLDLLELDLLV